MCENIWYLHNSSVLARFDEKDGEYSPEFRLERAWDG
jgi:hypothetical protein